VSVSNRVPRAPPPGPDQLPLRDWHETVVGGKSVMLFEKHVRSLREESLRAFHNHTIRSLRTFADFSQPWLGQTFLSVTKVCRITLSDAHKRADPTAACNRLCGNCAGNPHASRSCVVNRADLKPLRQLAIAVDGTGSLFCDVRHGACRLGGRIPQSACVQSQTSRATRRVPGIFKTCLPDTIGPDRWPTTIRSRRRRSSVSRQHAQSESSSVHFHETTTGSGAPGSERPLEAGSRAVPLLTPPGGR
jgi:hypothetical protein